MNIQVKLYSILKDLRYLNFSRPWKMSYDSITHAKEEMENVITIDFSAFKKENLYKEWSLVRKKNWKSAII